MVTNLKSLELLLFCETVEPDMRVPFQLILGTSSVAQFNSVAHLDIQSSNLLIVKHRIFPPSIIVDYVRKLPFFGDVILLEP